MQKCNGVSFGSYSLFIIKHRQQQLWQQKKQNFWMMEIKRIKKKVTFTKNVWEKIKQTKSEIQEVWVVRPLIIMLKVNFSAVGTVLGLSLVSGRRGMWAPWLSLLTLWINLLYRHCTASCHEEGATYLPAKMPKYQDY